MKNEIMKNRILTNARMILFQWDINLQNIVFIEDVNPENFDNTVELVYRKNVEIHHSGINDGKDYIRIYRRCSNTAKEWLPYKILKRNLDNPNMTVDESLDMFNADTVSLLNDPKITKILDFRTKPEFGDAYINATGTCAHLEPHPGIHMYVINDQSLLFNMAPKYIPDSGVITLANTYKWRHVSLLMPDLTVHAIYGFDDIRYNDDKWHPKELWNWCDKHGLWMDDVTYESLLGRWVDEVHDGNIELLEKDD